MNPIYCAHPDAVPVTSGGETVAALCPACDVQLGAAWFTCAHVQTIETPCLGELRGRMICNGCGSTFWDGDKAHLARLLEHQQDRSRCPST